MTTTIYHQSLIRLCHQSVIILCHQSLISLCHKSLIILCHQSLISMCHQSLISICHRSRLSPPHFAYYLKLREVWWNNRYYYRPFWSNIACLRQGMVEFNHSCNCLKMAVEGVKWSKQMVEGSIKELQANKILASTRLVPMVSSKCFTLMLDKGLHIDNMEAPWRQGRMIWCSDIIVIMFYS